MFLECLKSEMTIERQLDHLDKFTCGKHFLEADYEIPNLEGKIPILDQNLEFMPLVPEEQAYMVVAKETKEIGWLKKILEDLQDKQVQPTPLLIDNTYAIQLTKNPKFHDRTKHINTKFHLI